MLEESVSAAQAVVREEKSVPSTLGKYEEQPATLEQHVEAVAVLLLKWALSPQAREEMEGAGRPPATAKDAEWWISDELIMLCGGAFSVK